MTPEEAEGYIKTITATNSLDVGITIVGGEPLLNVDLIIKITGIARKYGVGKIGVDSNASWATTIEKAIAILTRVKDANISLGISADAFHQNFIPMSCVSNALEAARRIGYPVGCASRFLDSQDAVNPYDKETLRIISSLRAEYSEKDVNFSSDRAVFQGRGINLSNRYEGRTCLPTDTCRGVPWFATEDFAKLGGIQIDPLGWVMVDHGICIGNVKEATLTEILDSYQPSSHPILSVLMKEGPLGLARMAESLGYHMRESGYADKCHLCHEVRTFLRPNFPGVLEPAHYYPEMIKGLIEC
jgi:hypothetical protein